MIREKILVINPGSTSTKVAVYEGNTQKWMESINHLAEDLKQFDLVYDQLEMRTELIRKLIASHGDKLDSFNAIASRGGNMPSVKSGAYVVTDYMVECLKYRPIDEHAANVGAGIALALAEEVGINAYIYDALTVDEMLPVNKISGIKGVRRPARGHNLNTRAVALKLCYENRINYNDVNIVVAHLGGGITINLHSKGRIVDIIMDEEGPFSPERAGGIPTYSIVKMAFSGDYTQKDLMKQLQRRGGMISYFDTADMREVESMIDKGNSEVKLVYEAMALAVAKNIAKIVPGVKGKVDHIVLTGGLAHSGRFTDEIIKYIEFIAPVTIIAGENEMQSLAEGVLRVLKGQEKAKILENEDDGQDTYY